MKSDVVLSLRNVGVRFKLNGKRGFHEPLKGIDLDIKAGETLGILGRNGAGKSTLLKVLSGALTPDSGEVLNHGASVALLALQAGFDSNLTGRDNAIFGGMLLGHPKKCVIERVEEIKAYSELGDYFEEPVRNYSTGMASRLGFAISTIMSPDVILVDEVLSVGDASFKKKAERTMIQKIASGQTVVLVSHSQGQIAALCDRCVILEGGKLITGEGVGQVMKLYEEIIANKR
ncbi:MULTISPECIES: ABC transporter ATP-binding protein [Pseudomonas]|jgi:lipopolysaccharide transport system ATP-binding protein|uniref:ABC transporter ATP-binding protein n=1 Tax=Pseudomonas TaxID=286 RepID=UPI000A1FE217|nr:MULTISPECIES: ABC transporter ATP-binding protein [Pseudomonas]MCO7535521.1 ABC transporter ATP-binding protein [Pseudomonas asiatica]MCO7549034.1 ABC transporter ATP-binding protein [Pseudomonas asiatica]MCO7561419.1 ABC transporter ATP-binding protein [Pseudomonas asiatica]